MRNNKRAAALVCFLILSLLAAACKSDAFVGSWKPVETAGTDNDHMRIDTFDINKDGTFTIKYNDGKRKDVNGTFTRVGDKLELTGPGQRGKVEASIVGDGRLGVSEGGGPIIHFVRK
jgi:hypothetical protein